MSTYVAQLNQCCNNFNYQRGMYMGPYLTQDIMTNVIEPRIKPYSGWSSYKNVKSGQYNRELCWSCKDFKGFPQDPGVYNLNIINTPLNIPDYNKMKIADENYQTYQKTRMSNFSNINNYNNYLMDNKCYYLYPKQYINGNWPDEQLIYTNTPSNGCNIINNF
jgi:hypothetical protein